MQELRSRLQSAGLPRLPIAIGDKAIRGEGKMIKGRMCAYFSNRNEATALDDMLKVGSFPQWFGANAAKSNAAQQPMQLEGINITKSTWPKLKLRFNQKTAKKEVGTL